MQNLALAEFFCGAAGLKPVPVLMGQFVPYRKIFKVVQADTRLFDKYNASIPRIRQRCQIIKNVLCSTKKYD